MSKQNAQARAMKAVQPYAPNQQRATVFLLADLQHLADFLNLDWAATLADADGVYQNDINEWGTEEES